MRKVHAITSMIHNTGSYNGKEKYLPRSFKGCRYRVQVDTETWVPPPSWEPRQTPYHVKVKTRVQGSKDMAQWGEERPKNQKTMAGPKAKTSWLCDIGKWPLLASVSLPIKEGELFLPGPSYGIFETSNDIIKVTVFWTVKCNPNGSVFLKSKFIYLFWVVLGLHCCVRAFSSCG